MNETGLKKDKLDLIYEANKSNEVSVQTPHGPTDRITVEKIVMQGETFAPLECSVQVDTFGKECLRENKLLLQYKGEVGIPPLSLVDDLVSVSRCGIESVRMNAFLNAKTNLKKLQYGEDKCHKLHVGKKTEICPNLLIDTWTVKAADEYQTNVFDLIDEEGNQCEVQNSDCERYLGDLISTDAKNIKNILARKSKGQGILKAILSKLEDICFGPYYFEVPMMFRQSLFLNSILLNSEVWYNLTTKDIQELESVDTELLRRILEAPVSTPTCMLFLELGCIPLKYVVMQRRQMFLHYVLQQKPDSLLLKCLNVQIKHLDEWDWVNQIYSDLQELKIILTFEQIRLHPKEKFRSLVRKAILQAALCWLTL